MDTALASALTSWLQHLPPWLVLGAPTLLLMLAGVYSVAGLVSEKRLQRAERRMALSLQRYIDAEIWAEERSQQRSSNPTEVLLYIRA